MRTTNIKKRAVVTFLVAALVLAFAILPVGAVGSYQDSPEKQGSVTIEFYNSGSSGGGGGSSTPDKGGSIPGDKGPQDLMELGLVEPTGEMVLALDPETDDFFEKLPATGSNNLLIVGLLVVGFASMGVHMYTNRKTDSDYK